MANPAAPLDAAAESTYDVFLAHAGADGADARRLYDALVAADIRVFLDSVCLKCGDCWDVELPKAQAASRCTLVLVTAATRGAFYQREEVARAVAMSRKEGSTHRTIPVYLSSEPVSDLDIPYGLRVLHGMTAEQGGDFTEVVERLIPVLRGDARRAPARPEGGGWAWWSRSPDRGTISVLALMETLGAMMVYGFIAAKCGTKHFAVSACLAPLVLLRTRESQAMGLRFGPAVVGWMFRHVVNPAFRSANAWKLNRGLKVVLLFLATVCLFPVVLAAVAVLAFSVRVGATLLSLLRHPLGAIRAIPENWWRNVACVDSTQPPEVLPGVEAAMASGDFDRVDPDVRLLSIRSVLRLTKDDDVMTAVLLWGFLGVPYLVFVAFPAFAYRWSLKGTAIVYSPFVWLVHATFRPSLGDRLQDVRDLAYHRLIRLYSTVVLAALAMKLLLREILPGWLSRLPSNVDVALITKAVAPSAFPPWQIAMVVNAVLALVIYLVADWALAPHARARRLAGAALDHGLRSVWLVRGALSIYVIVNGIWGAAALAGLVPA